MIDHSSRIRGTVKAALKEAAMGEPFGYFVEFTYCPTPVKLPNGTIEPVGPPLAAWFIGVSIRATGVGDPDVVDGWPVYGFVPSDEELREIAAGVLERARRKREGQNAAIMAAMPQGETMNLKDRPAA